MKFLIFVLLTLFSIDAVSGQDSIEVKSGDETVILEKTNRPTRFKFSSSTTTSDDLPVPFPAVLPTPDKKPIINIPNIPVIEEPIIDVPPPEPNPIKPVTDIADEEHWYIIEADVPLTLLHSPSGLLDIEVIPTTYRPYTVRGKFADGKIPNKPETRHYSLKHIYIVTAKAKGKTELFIIPPTVETEKDVQRRILNVMGNGPNPPPKPDPDPDPTPGPTPDPEPIPSPKIASAVLRIVEKSNQRTTDTAIVLSALAAWNDLFDRGHSYRMYDVTTKEPNGLKAIVDAGQTTLPVLLFYDKTTDKLIHSTTLPKTFEEFQSIVNQKVK
jgi:hypothetical protein